MKKQVMCWIGLLACCLGFLMAASPVWADEDLMEKGLWDNSVSTADINGQSNSDLINSASTANLPYFPFQKISTSGMRSVGTNVAIDKDATLTFVLPAGSSFSTVGYKSNGKDVGNNFDKFILVLSIAAKDSKNNTYLDFAKGPIKAHVGSVTGNNPVKTDKSGSYIPISNNSDLIQMGDHKITLKQDLYFTVDLATAAPFDIDQITVSQQFGNLGASTANNQTSYIKLKMGVLSFSLTLKPKLTNVFMFPTPITVDGDKYLGIASGTGTLAKDSIRWAVNATAQTNSPVATTVSDTKKWLWLIPDNGDTEAIKGGAQLSVLETSGQGDTSTTDQDTIEDNSKYLNTEGGQALVDKLTDLVKKYKEGSADPTVLDNIIKEVETTITDINDTIDLEKEIGASDGGFQMTFDNNQNFVFANKASSAAMSAIKTGDLKDPTMTTTANLLDDNGSDVITGLAGNQQVVQWSAYRSGTGLKVDQDGSNLVTLAPNTSGASCDVTVNAGTTAADLKEIDLVATWASTEIHIKVSKPVRILALASDPDPVDVSQTTASTLKLVNLPDDSSLKYSWEKISVSNGQSSTPTTTDSTLALSNLSYLNYGDWYQVTVTKDGQKPVYSNIVQLSITGKQPPRINVIPDNLTFTNNGAKPRLDQIINGTFDWNQPLTASTDDFAFGSHMGEDTNWSISARVAPFTTDTGQQLAGNVQLKFNFTPVDSIKNSGLAAGTLKSSAVTASNSTESTMLFSNDKTVATDFDLHGNLSAEMKIHAPAAQATNYHSTITWTAGANTSTPAAK